MVTPDWSAPPRPPKINFVAQESTAANSLLARPLDRLAAVIVDLFVVLAPLYILLSAPLKKWMTASFLMGSEAEFASTIAGMVGIAVGLIVVYQTFMHYFFAATVGKFLFDLRVVAMFPNERVTCWDCFIRAWAWVGEVLCLGLPMLAVFSNNKRRPLHDRMCDTIVISRNAGGVLAPALWEQTVVRGMFGFLIVGILVIALVEVRTALEKIKSDTAFAALIDRETGACEVVSRNINEDGEVKEHERLELAMTLYAAGLADRSCLEAEVEREVAMQTPVGAVTYLAQAFVYADEAEVSNSYLDEVCESAPGTVECAMSEVVSKWSDEDWEAVEDSLTRAPRGSGYLEVWGIRHFMKQARYDKALALLDNLAVHKPLSDFSMVQRVKALFNSYRAPEAEAALMTAVSALPDNESKDLSAWVCAQQLQSGCAALETSACGQLNPADGEKIGEIDFEMSNEALARVLAIECQADGKMDYKSFGEAVNSEDWRMFFQANVKRQSDDKNASAHLFSQLILSPDAPELLKVEAARRWAQFADRKQTEELFQQWRDIPSKEAWVKTGNFLFKRYTEMGDHKLALKVARYLMNDQALAPQALAALANMQESKDTGKRAPASIKRKKGSEEE